ncbi:hypothetical protein Mapa_001270 [Marchantia paleacea]|nr:hypothetical protein Mapa_001270 [Marchantia paleacea]
MKCRVCKEHWRLLALQNTHGKAHKTDSTPVRRCAYNALLRQGLALSPECHMSVKNHLEGARHSI